MPTNINNNRATWHRWHNTSKTKKIMNKEQKEIIQDVIDRLIYLSPEQLIEYKNQLSLAHEHFTLNVQNIGGLRTYLNPRAV